MKNLPARRTVGPLAALAGVLSLSIAALAGPAGAAPDAPEPDRAKPNAALAPVGAQVLTPDYSEKEVRVMARTSGRTIAAQRARLGRETEANNDLARLKKRGFTYRDGAFLDKDGNLVVRADKGSKAAQAATRVGAEVRPAARGEQRLQEIQKGVEKTGMDGIAALEVDVRADKLVVRRSGELSKATAAYLAEHRAAVEVVKAPRNSTQITVLGGDAVYGSSGGRCSAGFPARNSSGARLMVWAGHCLEGSTGFTSGGQTIGRFGASAFKSYDGQPDRDLGYVTLDSEDSISKTSQSWGTGQNHNGLQGASKPAVGTSLCKSGSTTGITCGQIRSYNNSITYQDEQGRIQAQVSGLMSSTVCTMSGDSGGAYTSGGYAVGLTSGGPSTQRCTYNGGNETGKTSYVQPVTDALSYYGLTYG